uniref:(northern house mosquito) hypothetical protein n=1 Tax=Culex pipiens TaxID=7175 RepID=A0A8D8AUX3_CULPI
MGMYLYVLFYSLSFTLLQCCVFFAGFESSLEGVLSKKKKKKTNFVSVCVVVFVCGKYTDLCFVDLRRGGEEQRFAWRSSQFAFGFILLQFLKMKLIKKNTLEANY